MVGICHAIFWLQIIYKCLRKPKMSSQKKASSSKPQFFWCKKLPLKYQNLKDFIQGGDFPDAVFSWWENHNSRSWGSLLIASIGAHHALPAELLQSLFQHQKSISWHIPVSQAFATKWANDPRVTKPWCGCVVSCNFSSSLTCPPNKNKGGQRWEVENKWGNLTKSVLVENVVTGIYECMAWKSMTIKMMAPNFGWFTFPIKKKKMFVKTYLICL